jgi:hypothetical protein
LSLQQQGKKKASFHHKVQLMNQTNIWRENEAFLFLVFMTACDEGGQERKKKTNRHPHLTEAQASKIFLAQTHCSKGTVATIRVTKSVLLAVQLKGTRVTNKTFGRGLQEKENGKNEAKIFGRRRTCNRISTYHCGIETGETKLSRDHYGAFAKKTEN